MSGMLSRGASRTLRHGLAALALIAGPALVVVSQAQPAGATTFTVDDTADGAPVASDCTTPVPGSCSLRDAIAAVANNGTHTISLAPGVTYQLTYCADTTGRELRLNSTGSVTIAGNGATIEQTCALDDANGVMEQSGTGSVIVSDVTLTGGNSTDGSGGFNSGNGTAPITLSQVTITGNTAPFQTGASACGPMTIIDSTVTGNTATVAGFPAVHQCDNDLLVVNSTITGNTGGGIDTNEGATVTLVYSTVAGNSAPSGSNLDIFGGAFESWGAVITDPQGGGGNCSTAGTSQGYNYESGGDTCGFSSVTDVADGADPQLGALADNGGPTETMLPADASPLLDRIPVANCQDGDAATITTDQRGITRPQGTGCDVGAVELEVVTPPEPPTPPTPPTPPVTPAAAVTIAPKFSG